MDSFANLKANQVVLNHLQHNQQQYQHQHKPQQYQHQRQQLQLQPQQQLQQQPPQQQGYCQQRNGTNITDLLLKAMGDVKERQKKRDQHGQVHLQQQFLQREQQEGLQQQQQKQQQQLQLLQQQQQLRQQQQQQLQQQQQQQQLQRLRQLLKEHQQQESQQPQRVVMMSHMQGVAASADAGYAPTVPSDMPLKIEMPAKTEAPQNPSEPEEQSSTDAEEVESLGAFENAESDDQYQAMSSEAKTTLMVRNVPVMYTQDMLLSEWPNDASYDFLYLPRGGTERRNLSYAFINFVSEAKAVEFKAQWQKKRLAFFSSKKPLNISFAEVQGLEANLALLKKKRLRWHSVNW